MSSIWVDNTFFFSHSMPISIFGLLCVKKKCCIFVAWHASYAFFYRIINEQMKYTHKKNEITKRKLEIRKMFNKANNTFFSRVLLFFVFFASFPVLLRWMSKANGAYWMWAHCSRFSGIPKKRKTNTEKRKKMYCVKGMDRRKWWNTKDATKTCNYLASLFCWHHR